MENDKLSETAMFKYLIHAAINIQAQNKAILSLLATIRENEDYEVFAKVEKQIGDSKTELSN